MTPMRDRICLQNNITCKFTIFQQYYVLIFHKNRSNFTTSLATNFQISVDKQDWKEVLDLGGILYN